MTNIRKTGADPVLALYGKWVLAQSELKEIEDSESNEYNAAFDRKLAIEDELIETPATSWFGLVAKTKVAAYLTRLDISIGETEAGLNLDQRVFLSCADDAERLQRAADAADDPFRGVRSHLFDIEAPLIRLGHVVGLLRSLATSDSPPEGGELDLIGDMVAESRDLAEQHWQAATEKAREASAQS